MTLKYLRQIISLGALLLALLHIIWPQLAIDVVALTLIVISILPWLAPLVKSLELPGGWKVEFQEFQQAALRAESAGLLSDASGKKDTDTFSFQEIAARDPNLALAGLRIEIEKRLSSLSKIHNLATRPLSVGQSLRSLEQAQVLTNEERSIISDMVRLLNEAVHGAKVDDRAAKWAIEIGPRLLSSLDERISEAKERATN